ncbi:MAG: serine/threonine-protein kinase [Acidobacteriia bacterium]|nr:serine/threonine-protein kinase [Terriglobia bacterium]
MTGQIISHYRILDKLGEGGMGVVYKAEDLKLKRMVALKFLPGDDPELKQRFLQEAQAAAALHHPNICTVFEIDEQHGFLAMEFVEGSTLKARIAERPLKLDEACDIAAQISAGLQAAHGKNVTHRDIKPGNVMVTPEGVVKIMDFGLARIGDRSRITKTGSALGTPAYMSPEQARGEEADRRTDIWSFGVVLYEMITGRLPFAGDNEAAIARAILDDNPESVTSLRTGLPVELDRILTKALAKKPSERYQHVEDLCVDLGACQKAPAGSSVRTRKIPVGWIVAAAACAAGIAAGLWIGRSQQRWQNPLEGARYTRVTDFEGTETDAAISPDGKLIGFVSDRDGQYDLWVTQVGTQNYVNLTQGKVSPFFNLDTRPLGFSSDASHLWFQREARGTQPSVTMLIPSFGGPARPFVNAVSVAWSPDGRRIVYHTAQSGDPMFVSDPDGGNAIELFRREAGAHSHYPVWSPDGRFVYFVSGYPPDQMDIWRVPASGGKPERLTSHNSRVRYPALLDDETLLYIATADDGSGLCLYVMHLADRIPHRATAGLEQYISVTADEAANRPRRLVATLVNPTAGLWSVPITAGIAKESAVARIPTPNAQTQSPRTWGDEIFYLAASGPSHSLWRRDSNGRASELWKASGGGLVAPPAVSPDGKLICFSFRRKDRAGLHVMNADGTNLRTLSNSFQVRSAASWSPDSKWVAVSGDEGKGSRVFKVAVDGGAPVRLLDTQSSGPVWSLDGQLIIYGGPDIGGNQAVFAMTPEGKPVPFPELKVRRKFDGYRFLPDGKSMVFVLGFSPFQTFWLLDLASGQRRQLTDLQPAFDIQSFDVTPDGKRIIFDRIRANADVVLIELAQK